MIARGDQLVCQFCGKSFPLSPDGSDAFRAHQVAELAIEAQVALESIATERARDATSTNQKKTGQQLLPGLRSS